MRLPHQAQIDPLINRYYSIKPKQKQASELIMLKNQNVPDKSISRLSLDQETRPAI